MTAVLMMTLGFAYLVWFLVCVGIYAKLGDVIPSNVWHYKLYREAYDLQPKSDCSYFWRLIWAPIVFGIWMIIAVVVSILGAVFCCIKDWIIEPVLSGKCPMNVNRLYWGNVFGNSISDYNQPEWRWRPAQEYKTVLLFKPYKYILALLAVAGVVFLGYKAPQYIASLEMFIVFIAWGISILVAIFAAIWYRKSIVSTLVSAWRKFKERTCHVVRVEEAEEPQL